MSGERKKYFIMIILTLKSKIFKYLKTKVDILEY